MTLPEHYGAIHGNFARVDGKPFEKFLDYMQEYVGAGFNDYLRGFYDGMLGKYKDRFQYMLEAKL